MDLTRLIRAVLENRPLDARQIVADAERNGVKWSLVDLPEGLTETEQALCAGLVEMLAERNGESPPAWTSQIGPAPTAVYLVRAAATLPRLRQLCEDEGPLPLRSRQLFAPPDYLTAA